MQIQVQINTEGALRNQRYAFTDRFTLISELLQNARRAGAMRIEIHYDAPPRCCGWTTMAEVSMTFRSS